MSLAHSDGRAYPWLSPSAPLVSADAATAEAEAERFLIYQPFAGMLSLIHI